MKRVEIPMAYPIKMFNGIIFRDCPDWSDYQWVHTILPLYILRRTPIQRTCIDYARWSRITEMQCRYASPSRCSGSRRIDLPDVEMVEHSRGINAFPLTLLIGRLASPIPLDECRELVAVCKCLWILSLRLLLLTLLSLIPSSPEIRTFNFENGRKHDSVAIWHGEQRQDVVHDHLQLQERGHEWWGVSGVHAKDACTARKYSDGEVRDYGLHDGMGFLDDVGITLIEARHTWIAALVLF